MANGDSNTSALTHRDGGGLVKRRGALRTAFDASASPADQRRSMLKIAGVGSAATLGTTGVLELIAHNPAAVTVLTNGPALTGEWTAAGVFGFGGLFVGAAAIVGGGHLTSDDRQGLVKVTHAIRNLGGVAALVLAASATVEEFVPATANLSPGFFQAAAAAAGVGVAAQALKSIVGRKTGQTTPVKATLSE